MILPTLYRTIKANMRKPLAVTLVTLAIIYAVRAIYILHLGTIPWVERNDEIILACISLLTIICGDYGFATGFRSGVLGYNLADVNFHMAGPFTRKFNLFMSFKSGLGSCLFLLWLITVQMPLLSRIAAVTMNDYIAFMAQGVFAMILGFLFSSWVSAKFSDVLWPKVVAIVALLVTHFIPGGVLFYKLIKMYGSFGDLKESPILPNLEFVGNSIWVDSLPVFGWCGLYYKGIVRGDTSFFPVLTAILLILLTILIVMYIKTDFDFYEAAMDTAQKVADLVEASRAGVETVNTGISRAVVVGNEKLEHGWGANAFFHMHLFINKRSSKFFFINVVALIYRFFGLIILEIMNAIIPEEIEFMSVVIGIVTMLVLNAIVFGGGKTVLEFNRPFLFLVPEKSSRKLAACILSDIPEIIFDSLVCSLIIKLVCKDIFRMSSFVIFIVLMIVFDFLSEISGMFCLRIFRNLGKYALMTVRYVMILFLIIAGMAPVDFFTMGLDPQTNTVMYLNMMMTGLAVSYAVLLIIFIFLSRNIVDRIDAD